MCTLIRMPNYRQLLNALRRRADLKYERTVEHTNQDKD